MNRRQSLQLSLASLAITMGLSACGGGGADESPTPAAPSPTAPSPSPSPVAPAPVPPPVQPPASGVNPPVVGLSWQAGTAIATAPATKVFAPAVNVSPNGQAHLMWMQKEGLSPVVGKLYAARAALADGRWSTPQLLAEGAIHGFSTIDSFTGLGHQANPLALLNQGSQGDVLALWGTVKDYVQSVMMRRFDAQTGQWSAAELLVEGHGSALRTTSSPAGHALIAWYHNGSSSTRILVIDPQGERRMLTLPSWVHKLAINSEGTVAATWSSGGRQRLAVSGALSWSEPIELPRLTLSADGWADLQIADNGEVALAWTLSDWEIASLVLRADGSYELPSTLRALNTSAKPSLVRQGNGWAMAFIGSHHSIGTFANGSVLMNSPQLSHFRWGQGWTHPQQIHSTGPAGVGHVELFASQADELSVVATGYNIGGYSLKGSSSTWSATTIAYDAMRPAVAMHRGSGQGVLAWSEGAVLSTQFRR